MNPVVHFEMPYQDAKRLSDFYSKVFGWDMKTTGPDFGNYVLAGTSPVDDKMMHVNKGAINGGFYPKGEFGTTSHVVISVPDIKKHIEIVKKAGGTVESDPINIPGIGEYAMFHDTEGNRVGMLQPASM